MELRCFVASVIGILLTPELALAQASASVTVRAEVRQTCASKSKKKECNPKPPKDDDEDEGYTDLGGASRLSAAVQSVLENAEATGVEGVTVLPFRLIVWLADPKDPLATPDGRSPPDRIAGSMLWKRDNHGVITVIAEY